MPSLTHTLCLSLSPQAVVLLQTDIHSAAELQSRLAALTETQLSMLSNMFPQCVLDFIMTNPEPSINLATLAKQHESVSILFMDVVGGYACTVPATTLPRQHAHNPLPTPPSLTFSLFRSLTHSFSLTGSVSRRLH
jgi:hypothetical protein